MHSRSRQTGAPTDRARIELLDALRGFALLGILVANLVSFTGWDLLDAEARTALSTSALDPAVRFLHGVFVHGKFYTLFSLLFGIGFAIQLTRAVDRGDRFVSRYARRLLVLLVIGLVHVFVWIGDILVLYALCGFALLLFRNCSDRTLLAWATGLILLPVVQYAVSWLTNNAFEPAGPLYALGDDIEAALEIPADRFPVYATGGWLEVARINASNLVYRLGDYVWDGRPFKVLGVFVIGLWAGRRILAGTLLDDVQLLRRLVVAGLTIGLPANIVLASLLARGVAWPLSGLGVAQFALYALGVVPLGLAYAAGFALVWRHRFGRRLLGLFAPAGRLALTCYLGQTAIGIAIFYGIGFGMSGKVGPAAWTVLAIVVFAAQVMLSALWLRHFRVGPMEWLWRWLAGGRPPPMRRA